MRYRESKLYGMFQGDALRGGRVRLLRQSRHELSDFVLTGKFDRCKKSSEPYYPQSLKRDHPKEIVKRAYSTDGTCGPNHGNTLCDPNSTVYKGTCCSSYGWCGNTPAHCGTGCQSGCTGAAPVTDPTAPRSDARCGSAFAGATCDPNGPFGGCCSSAGYCGKDAAHCTNGCQSGCVTSNGGVTTTASSKTRATSAAATSQEPVLGVPSTAPATGPATTDGTCGANNGNTVCGNWPQGSCCSAYGFCGSTTAHCGNGCQSGPCTGAPATPAPGPAPAPANPNGGSIKVVGQAGVPAMHAGLLPNGKVVFLDKVENYTQIKLPNGQYAYSAEYDPASNTVVGLQYKVRAPYKCTIFLTNLDPDQCILFRWCFPP